MNIASMALIVAVFALVVSVQAADAPSTQPAERTTASGLKITETKSLSEALVATAGDVVWVQYTGKLANGTKFDSSFDRKDERTGVPVPISFRLGKGEVIKGWDEGVAGMKVGEKRTLTIPPDLAYGDAGAGGVIPPKATLTFDVELVGIYRDK